MATYLSKLDAQAGDGKDEEQDTFDEDRRHGRPPGDAPRAPEADDVILHRGESAESDTRSPTDRSRPHPSTLTYREIGVETHARRKGERQVGEGSHHEAREEGRYCSDLPGQRS